MIPHLLNIPKNALLGDRYEPIFPNRKNPFDSPHAHLHATVF